MLLPYTPDWRWHGRRAESPWYTTLRLFHQPKPRDWTSVVAQARDAIASLPGAADLEKTR